MLSERLNNPTPAELGFRMPAEWEPHVATLMSWPRNQETWPNNLREAQAEFLELASAIAADEPVFILVAESEAPKLPSTSPLQILPVPTDDAWLRDYGPTYTVSNEHSHHVAIDWKYNAWGGKYPPFDLDQQATTRILQSHAHELDQLVIPYPAVRYTSDLCIEGGAIEVNNKGVLLTTRTCALDKNRNPDWSAAAVESELKRCLGADHIVWLAGDSIIGDDTDGHIDQLARFVSDSHIVYCTTNEISDPQTPGLDKNYCDLKNGLNELESEFELSSIPLPDPISMFGNRLPASYCNFYITNKSVIVPQFDDRQSDQRAVRILTELFPSRNVFGLPSKHLVVGLGSFHCLTQQVPAANSTAP